MNDFNNDAAPGGGFSVGKLIAVILFLTIGIAVVMMVFLKNDSESQKSTAPAAPQLFKPDEPAPAGYNPASRAGSMVSGGSLEMLGETNAGLFKEEPAGGKRDESIAENAPPAAAPKTARTARKAKSKEVVIPRLQKSEGFGVFDKKKAAGARPVNMPAGASMPANIQDMLKTVPQQMPAKEGR